MEKKRLRTGAERGGVGDRGAAARRYGVRPSAWDLDLDLDLDSLELAGSSRHGQGGKARSSLVRKDAQGRGVLAALHDRITAAATPEESRTIGGTEGEGARRDSRGPKARQMAGSRARGLGVPGLRGGGGGGGLGGAETRRGARERVLWLSSCRRQSCNPQISKSLPLRLCLRCCSRESRGCSRERGDGDGGGAHCCCRARGPRRRGRGRELETRSIGRRRALSRGRNGSSWMDWRLAASREENGRRRRESGG